MHKQRGFGKPSAECQCQSNLTCEHCLRNAPITEMIGDYTVSVTKLERYRKYMEECNA